MNRLQIGLSLENNVAENLVKSVNRGKQATNDFSNRIKEVEKRPIKDQVMIKETKPLEKKNIEIEEVEKISEENLEELILSMFATYLQLPIEQVQEKLNELGVQVTELLKQDDFMNFLSEVYGQSIEELLVTNSEVKEISKLWEALKNLKVPTKQQSATDQIVTPLDEGGEVVDTQTQEVAQGSFLKETQILANGEVKITHKQNLKETDGLDQIQAENEMIKDTATLLAFKIPAEVFGQGEKTKMWEQATQKQILNTMTSSEPIDTQILTKLQVNPNRESREIHMDLAPKELGKLSIKMVENNGIFTAQIQVEHEKTKEVLLQNIQSLKEGLEKQGMMIGSFEVNVNGGRSQSHMQKQKQKATKRIEEIMAKHLLAIEKEKKEMQQASEVDLMA